VILKYLLVDFLEWEKRDGVDSSPAPKFSIVLKVIQDLEGDILVFILILNDVYSSHFVLSFLSPMIRVGINFLSPALCVLVFATDNLFGSLGQIKPIINNNMACYEEEK
jgi:hypothetical protein